MHLARAIAVPIAVCAALALTAGPAHAAPPGNDTSGGAVAISVGDSLTVDTTEATTDAQDTQANASCGAPATDASVWFTYTAAGDGGVVLDLSASTYSAGAIVATGSPGALQLVECGPRVVGFSAAAGTTYSIIAFDDQFDGSGNGGTLALTVNAAPPPPTVDVTVDPRGTANKDGSATFTGTYTCTDADFIDVFGDVTQRVGRGSVDGILMFFDVGTCDGLPHAWEATAVQEDGKFAGGKSVTLTFSFACGAFECVDGFTEQVVQLRRARR